MVVARVDEVDAFGRIGCEETTQLSFPVGVAVACRAVQAGAVNPAAGRVVQERHGLVGVCEVEDGNGHKGGYKTKEATIPRRVAVRMMASASASLFDFNGFQRFVSVLLFQLGQFDGEDAVFHVGADVLLVHVVRQDHRLLEL